MNRTRLRLALSGLAALCVGLSGCALVPGPRTLDAPVAGGATDSTAPVAIERVEAVFENIHPSFWTAGDENREARLFFSPWIHLSSQTDLARLVREVRIHDPYGRFWALDARSYSEHGGYYGGWLRLRDTHLSDNGTMLALTDLRVEVVLRDGSVVTEPVGFPEPNSRTRRARFLVSEEYRGTLTADHAFALERPRVTGASLSSGTLTVTFDPTDSRAANGEVILLSADREVVAQSLEFYNEISREGRLFLNDGLGLRSAGPANTARIPVAQLRSRDGLDPADARYLYVKIRDGAQFAFTADAGAHYHVSRSALWDLVEGRTAE